MQPKVFRYLLSFLFVSIVFLQASVVADDVKQPLAPLSGKIIDDKGVPVTDATMLLIGDDQIEAHTGEDGTYEFFNVLPGEYRLRIKSKKWVGITEYRKMPRILIGDKNAIKRDITLARACTINIRAVDEAGRPIRHVEIYSASLADQSFRNTSTVHTGPDGRVTLGGLVPSPTKYLLAAEHTGYGFESTTVLASDPDKTVEHEFVMRKGITIRGKAVCSDGKPPAGWKILALPDWWHFAASPSGKAIDDDGSFALRHIVGGKYRITISVPSGERGSMPRIVLDNAELTKMDHPLKIKMDYPSPGSLKYLDGKVRWIGTPLNEGFWIFARTKDDKHHTSNYVKAGEKTFRLGPTPGGLYKLQIDHPDLEVMNQRQIKNLPGLDQVTIPLEKPFQLAVRARGRPQISGIVTDAKTNKPIAEFRYRVRKEKTLRGPNYSQDENWVQVRSDDGAFTTDVVGPGVYRVAVRANGYAISESESANTDESDEVISIKLDEGAQLHGKIVDGDGKSIDDAIVIPLSVLSGPPPLMTSQVTDEMTTAKTVDGEFRLLHLTPGEEVIRVLHPDYVFTDVASVNVGKQVDALKITLSKGGTVGGQVFDEHGKPAPDVALVFHIDSPHADEDDRIASIVTDKNGEYEVEHLPNQICFVSRVDEWESLGVVRHAVLPSPAQVSRLDLGGIQKLSGQVSIDGQPLAQTKLQLGGSDGNFGGMKMYAITDKQGSFKFIGAPPGHWSLYYESKLQQRSAWKKLRELDMPAIGDTELGAIEMPARDEGESKEIAENRGKVKEEDAGYALVSVHDANGRFVPCQIKFVDDNESRIEQHQNYVETFMRGLAGDHTVTIQHPGYKPLRQTIRLNVPDKNAKSRESLIVRLRLE